MTRSAILQPRHRLVANVGSLVLDRQRRVRELCRHGRLGCTAIINNQAATSLGTLYEPKVCHPIGPLGAVKWLFVLSSWLPEYARCTHQHTPAPRGQHREGLHRVRRLQLFLLRDVGACLHGDSVDARLLLEVVDAVSFQLQVDSLQRLSGNCSNLKPQT